jgi:hypothetical protein
MQARMVKMMHDACKASLPHIGDPVLLFIATQT